MKFVSILAIINFANASVAPGEIVKTERNYNFLYVNALVADDVPMGDPFATPEDGGFHQFGFVVEPPRTEFEFTLKHFQEGSDLEALQTKVRTNIIGAIVRYTDNSQESLDRAIEWANEYSGRYANVFFIPIKTAETSDEVNKNAVDFIESRKLAGLTQSFYVRMTPREHAHSAGLIHYLQYIGLHHLPHIEKKYRRISPAFRSA